MALHPTPTNSLERALALLEMVGQAAGGLTNAELSRRLGIATSSCTYILSRLEKEGFLARDPETGRYEIGIKVLAIARGALRPLTFRKVAQPALQRLSRDTGLDVVMGVLDEDRLMVVSRISSVELSTHDVDTGTEFPAHATAMGKVLLSHRIEEHILSWVEKKGLAKLTPRTITAASDLLAELEGVRKRGYGTSDEEHTPGLRSIAAPIVDSEGAVRAAVAVVGTTKQMTWGDTDALVESLKAAAREISRLMRPVTR